jgi:hypothetical protein
MSEILADWLVQEGYRVEEPDDHTVELWHKGRLVARFDPGVSQASLNQVAIDHYIVHQDWHPLRSEP